MSAREREKRITDNKIWSNLLVVFTLVSGSPGTARFRSFSGIISTKIGHTFFKRESC